MWGAWDRGPEMGKTFQTLIIAAITSTINFFYENCRSSCGQNLLWTTNFAPRESTKKF